MATRRALKQRVDGGGQYFARPHNDVKFFSSGCKTLDMVLGGGWAGNRVINIVGDKSTGKTLLCIEAAANFVRKFDKAEVYYIEVEAAFQKDYAAALGMPIDRVKFPADEADVETVEHVFNIIKKATSSSSNPKLVIVDSLDAVSDAAELERGFGEGSYGTGKAKDMSKLFRMLIRALSKNTTLIIVSQVRDKIGVTYGRKTTRSGGRALDFYASQVVYLAHVANLTRTNKKIKRVTGVKIKAKTDKNKIGLPFRDAEFNISFGWGIDDIAACLNWLKEVNSLKEALVTPDGITEYARSMQNVPRTEYDKVVSELHEIVERRWWEVEKSFLPSQSKYGEG